MPDLNKIHKSKQAKILLKRYLDTDCIDKYFWLTISKLLYMINSVKCLAVCLAYVL